MKNDPNYSRHLAGRTSLLLSSAHTAMYLKLRISHVTFIRRVQTYLKRLGFSVAYSTARKFVKTLGFKCFKKKNTAALSFKQIKRCLK
ncbi:hypothetical protein MAM1_0139c06356 [Mucor ambiguus]|uniref:Uncharacterized protein n=1 Tax=Mucor ambiguus TaxID=91626 RepID=A0A0C9M911_9FUNG|nr:hypothetical protein MAM1_0139c06356 [Mucor ambiguus]